MECFDLLLDRMEERSDELPASHSYRSFLVDGSGGVRVLGKSDQRTDELLTLPLRTLTLLLPRLRILTKVLS